MKPDPRLVRAVSGVLSEAELKWEGLPNLEVMRPHFGSLQKCLSNMLDGPPKTEAQPRPIPEDLGPGDGMPDEELDAALDRLGRPDAITIRMIRQTASDTLNEWLRTNTQRIRRRLADTGYEKVWHPTGPSGAWPAYGNTIIFARRSLTLDARAAAARELASAEKARAGGHENSNDPCRTPRRASKSTQTPLSTSDDGHEQ